MKVALYVDYNGDAEKAYDYYTEVFGGQKISLERYDEHKTDDPDLIGKVMHGEMKIHDFHLYLADTNQEKYHDCFAISVEFDSREELVSTFDKMTEGGEVLTGIVKTPVGHDIGIVRDKFGIVWNLVYTQN